MLLKSVLLKAVYSAACVAAASVLVAGYEVNAVVNKLSSLGGGITINGSSSTGPQTILVMGLESRTDYQGNTVDHHLQVMMHSGSIGGQDTNTLILIHIFAGGTHAIGFSIPRDDWVTYPATYLDRSSGKIDWPYDKAYTQSLDSTYGKGMSASQRYVLANHQGQAATIATVQQLTGVHIDHFAEVNLMGFYYMAQAFGGIEACVKSYHNGWNLNDGPSGAHLKVGYQHLDAAQALAFVRERDHLPGTDIGRTSRQQAFLDYVVWQLRHQNILSSIGQIQSLLSTARQYIITDSQWNLLDFASQMHALSGKNLTFHTLPIKTSQTITLGGSSQDINIVDPNAIKAEVQQAFNPPLASPSPGSKSSSPAPPPPASYPLSDSTIDVYNAGAPRGSAHRVLRGLASAGLTPGVASNAAAQQATQVLFGSGTATQANAAKVATLFGVTAQPTSSVAAGHIQVTLGSGGTIPASFSSLTAGGGTAPAPSASAAASSPPSYAGTVTVSGQAPYGIPCVY